MIFAKRWINWILSKVLRCDYFYGAVRVDVRFFTQFGDKYFSVQPFVHRDIDISKLYGDILVNLHHEALLVSSEWLQWYLVLSL